MNFGSQSSSSDNEASHDGAQYISDEDFKKNLSEQELMIFNAIVIAIHQQHVNRQKSFHRRRLEHLKKQPDTSMEELENKATQYLRLQEQAMQTYQNQLLSAVQ